MTRPTKRLTYRFYWNFFVKLPRFFVHRTNEHGTVMPTLLHRFFVRRLWHIGALLVFALMLLGCGGGGTVTPAPAPSQPPSVFLSAVKVGAAPVIAPSQPWEGNNVEDGSVVKVGSTFYRFYCAGNVPFDIGYATATESGFPLTWTKYAGNPVIRASQFGALSVCAPRVIQMPDGSFRMYVHAFDGVHDRGYLLTSANFPNDWTIAGQVFTEGAPGAWDSYQIQTQSIIPGFASPDGQWHLFYFGFDGSTYRGGHATSADGVTWQRPSAPLMVPDSGWKAKHVGPLGWFKQGATYYILAQGYDGQRWSLGYYASTDLATFTPSPQAILTATPGAWDSSGIEGVDAIADGGNVWLFYLGSNVTNPVAGGMAYRTGVAKVGF